MQQQYLNLKKALENKDHLQNMYNDFVETLNKNNILLQSFHCHIGTSKQYKKESLQFDFTTDWGLTHDDATKIFKNFIQKYPEASIYFNVRNEPIIDDEILSVIDNAILIGEGFRLQKI